MIIKEKSIKSYVGLERVLRYILSKDAGDGFVHTRFIRGDRKYREQGDAPRDILARSIISEKRLLNMAEQFRENDKKRIHKRKGGTKFHHSIISFHERDDALTNEILLKVAKRYIRERFPKSLVMAVPHFDKGHLHIHLVGSHVQFGTGLTNYHTRKEFAAIKQRMESWQERELGLVHSKVAHGKKKPGRF